jgi:hypothetical protein
MENKEVIDNCLEFNFQSISNEQKFVDFANDYKKIWKEDGDKIIAAFLKTGLKFTEKIIDVIISGERGRSGMPNSEYKMKLSGGSKDKMRSSLIQELGHRFLYQIKDKENYSTHQILDLMLYDVWNDVYGKELADKYLQRECQFDSPDANYTKDWELAISLGSEGRRKVLDELIRKNNLN